MTSRPWLPYLCGLLIGVMLVWAAALNRYPLFNEDSEAYLRRPAMALKTLLGDRFRSEWIAAETSREIDAFQAGRAPEDRDAATSAPHSIPKATPMAGATASAVPETAAGAEAKSDAGRGWISGRSLYYGLVTYLAIWLGGIWAAVLLQGTLIGITIALFWFRGLGRTSVPQCLMLGGFVAIGTSASVFTGFITPDYLSGILIAGLALLAIAWDDLRLVDRAFVIAACSFAVMSHDSHLVIALAILVVMGLVRLAGRKRALPTVPAPAMFATLATIAAGLVGIAAFGAMSVKATGHGPRQLPFLTAHVVNMDETAATLRTICARDGHFAACRDAPRYPMSWIDFMFDRDPAVGVFAIADPERQRQLSTEQFALALALVRERPVAVPLAFARDGLRQLGAFRYVDLDQRDKARFYSDSFPPAVVARIRESLVWRQPDALTWLSRIHIAVVILSSIALIALATHLRRMAPALRRRLGLAGFLIVTGLFANAIICGVLASPYDRFGARAIWLLPWLAATGWLAWRGQTKEGSVRT